MATAGECKEAQDIIQKYEQETGIRWFGAIGITHILGTEDFAVDGRLDPSIPIPPPYVDKVSNYLARHGLGHVTVQYSHVIVATAHAENA